MVAGDYHLVTASTSRPAASGSRSSWPAGPGWPPTSTPGALFELARQGLDFYTGLLGVDYPYRKYGQVFVPELSCGASEDAGCILVSERLLSRSRVTAAMDESRAGTLLHEMAHMWFGDLVTEQWWDDLWLSESFADFCEYHACRRLGRFPEAWSTFSVGREGPRLRGRPAAVRASGGLRRGHAQRGDRQLRPDQLRQGRVGAPAAGRLRGRAGVLRRAPRLPGPACLRQRPAG